MEENITVKDVTNVENSRMLKRNGAPQDTHAYWQGIMPSLSTIQGMASIASEKKGKMQWNLVLQKPQEPYASAYTLEELKMFLKAYLGEHHKNTPSPEAKEVNSFALAVLSIIKGV